MKILSVDDDELILELLVESLAQVGFHGVTTVNSAQSALDLIAALDADNMDDEEGSFDCFLLDIEMPGMNGIELCTEIRKMPAYRRTPILMVTTLSDRNNIEKAFAAGATDYINKPFDQIELGSRIRLAKMLVNEQRRGLQAYFMASALTTGLDDEKTALFQAPITVEGVERVVDLQVLENFLLQLSRKGLYQSAAIAFKFTEAKEAFLNLGEAEYYELLEKVAALIARNFGKCDFLLSHFGSGLFVGVIDRSGAPIPENFGDILAKAAEEAGLKPKDGRPGIIVGDPVENPIHRRNDIHSMLLDATASVAEKTLRIDAKVLKVKPLVTKGLKFNLFSDK